MQVYYFNDEKVPVHVRVPKIGGEPWEYQYTELQHQQGRLFTFEAPEASIPYIKRWSDNTIMISWVRTDSLGANDIRASKDS